MTNPPRGGNPTGVDDDYVEQIAVTLKLTNRGARNRIDTARTLTQPCCQPTLTALLSGEITEYKIVIITEETHDIPATALATIQAELLPRAAALTPTRLRTALRRRVLRLRLHQADPVSPE